MAGAPKRQLAVSILRNAIEAEASLRIWHGKHVDVQTVGRTTLPFDTRSTRDTRHDAMLRFIFR